MTSPPMDQSTEQTTRAPLNRDRVLQAAVGLADESGIDAVSMRRLGQELGVEAMSLYNHVTNKSDVLAGMVEAVMGQINYRVDPVDASLPLPDWKLVLRRRILTARAVLLEHKWLPAALEVSSSMSAAVIIYHEGVLAILRAGGFSWDLAHHSLHALGSKALGFNQELFDPSSPADDAATQQQLASVGPLVPNLVQMLSEIAHDDPDSTLGWCDDQTEFEFGLDITLDGLERHLARN